MPAKPSEKKKGAKRKPEEVKKSAGSDVKKAKTTTGKKGSYKGKGFKGGKAKKPAFVPPSTKKEKRALKKARNMAKPNYETVAKANEVWQIFDEKMDKEQRGAKVAEILEGISGKMQVVANKHDVSRAFQRMIKNGTAEQRTTIFQELKGGLQTLSLHRNGKFIVLALLKCGVEAIRRGVLATLLDGTAKLALHNSSAPVIDYMYASGKPKERRRILAEFYGKEYSLLGLDEVPESLDSIFAKNPESKKLIMGNIERHVTKCASKKMWLYRPLHGLLWEYWQQTSGVTRETFLSQLAPQVLALHHSADGAKLVCECLAQGNPKTRKTILKGLKGKVAEMAQSEEAYMILVRALDVTDDTVLVKSSILNELQEVASDLVSDLFGHKVLLFIITSITSGYYTPLHVALLQPAMKDGAPTSKKPALVRRTDVLVKCLPWLLDLCIENAGTMLADKAAGSKVLYEVLREASKLTAAAFASSEEGQTLAEPILQAFLKLRPKYEAALGAVAALFADDDTLQLFHDCTGHFVLKRLLKNLSPNGQSFSALLLESTGPNLGSLALTRGAFVLAAMIENADKATIAKLKKALKPHTAAIKKEDKAGTQVLLKVMGGK